MLVLKRHLGEAVEISCREASLKLFIRRVSRKRGFASLNWSGEGSGQ